jgi:hypothetical protein
MIPVEDLLSVLTDTARREGHGEVPHEVDAESRRRALAAMHTKHTKRAPTMRRASFLAAAAFVMVLAVVVGFAWRRAPARLAFTIDGVAARAGAYVHGGGDSDQPPRLRFSDGSEIVFTPGSSGRVGEVDHRGARVLVESGAASFTIAHLPGARWSVEAGPFVIAVIGTVFDASWSVESQTLEVRVREGEVSVSGPLVADGAHVTAGRQLSANLVNGELRIGFIATGPQAAATAVAPPPAEDQTPPTAPAPSAVPSVRAPHTTTAPPPSAKLDGPPKRSAELRWPRRVAEGDYRGVLADADARGVNAMLRKAPLADLAALADAARYAGRPALARDALLSVRARFAGASEARAAAFLLGRLADDGGGPTRGAVAWYDTYLAESPSGPFAAEALGRKLTALRRAGDPAARSTADEYLRRYPEGPYAAAARELATP